MNIYVYSDGCRKGNRCSATSIILNDTDYLGLTTKRYDCHSSGEAELHGLYQGIQQIKRCKLDKDNKIIAKVDHESVVILYNKMKDAGIRDDVAYKEMWEKILDITKDINIDIKHIKGHQSDANCNKTCDIMSSMLL